MIIKNKIIFYSIVFFILFETLRFKYNRKEDNLFKKENTDKIR